MLATVRHNCCVPEGKLCKSWRRVGDRCFSVISDYAAVEMVPQNYNSMIRSNVNFEFVYRWHQARTAHGVL